MTPDEIRKIVQDELAKSRFNVAKVPFHTHNNVDSPTVNISNNNSVTEIIAGTGIGVSPSNGLGNVTVTNSGVTSLVAGTNISLSPVGGTGDVTVNATTSSGLSVGEYTFTLPSGTNVDTTASHDFGFVPKMVFGTFVVSTGSPVVDYLFAMWINGAEQNRPIASNGYTPTAGKTFLGYASGTPGIYLYQLSVSGTTLSWHYANSGADNYVAYLWAIG